MTERNDRERHRAARASLAPEATLGEDAALDRAMDVFRLDCRSRRTSPGLAGRVLSAVARGDAELSRFRRRARAYAAAAAVLAAAGAAGSLLVHRETRPPGAPSAPTTLAELEDFGLVRAGTDAIDALSPQASARRGDR